MTVDSLLQLCVGLQLGSVTNPPQELTGGLLNHMYGIETSKGKYAVKAINPQIMLRPTAMQNYINSEHIAQAAARVVPALPALRFNGDFLHQVENQYFLVFPWVEGRSLKTGEIQADHCRRMGEVLGVLHQADFSQLGIADPGPEGTEITDWGYYLELGQTKGAIWTEKLQGALSQIKDWNARAVKAAELLAKERVISHRDMDPKNVMWSNGSPVVIDWEAAGYVNPLQELLETAVYWSQAQGHVDRERFLAFLDGYCSKAGRLQADWNVVLDSGFSGKLGWMEYNLKRSLWLECSDEREQQLGSEEVVDTIGSIKKYGDMLPELEQLLMASSGS